MLFNQITFFSQPSDGYVCKRPSNGDWTTAAPTSVPEGHCPSDHYEFKGYCYKFFGLSSNATEHKNWTDAQRTCKNTGEDNFGGRGYDLASIHSDNEQAFLISIMAANDPGVHSTFWTGFRDFAHHDQANTFVWSDGSAVDYTNWDINEPNDNYYVENICVEM